MAGITADPVMKLTSSQGIAGRWTIAFGDSFCRWDSTNMTVRREATNTRNIDIIILAPAVATEAEKKIDIAQAGSPMLGYCDSAGNGDWLDAQAFPNVKSCRSITKVPVPKAATNIKASLMYSFHRDVKAMGGAESRVMMTGF